MVTTDELYPACTPVCLRLMHLILGEDIGEILYHIVPNGAQQPVGNFVIDLFV